MMLTGKSVAERRRRITLSRAIAKSSERFALQTLEARVLLAATPIYTVGTLPAVAWADGQPLKLNVQPPQGISGAIVPTLPHGYGTPAIATAGDGTRTYTYGSLVPGSQVTFAFNPNTGDFTYTPSASEHFPFDLTFTAPGRDGDGLPISQSLTVEPRGTRPEADLVSSSTSTLPDPESPDYITVNVTSNATQRFNAIDNVPTRNVEIVGKTIVIAPGQTNGLYERFAYQGGSSNRDIAYLSITAERVVFRGAVRFPQTNIVINAREMAFDDSNGIASLSTRPIDPASAATSGANGSDAGNIQLWIGSLTAAPTPQKRFVLDGAVGQAATQGSPGAPVGDGGSRPVDSSMLSPSLNAVHITQENHWYYTYQNIGGVPLYAIADYDPDPVLFGAGGSYTPIWPANGNPAVAGGTPGAGGHGGRLQISPNVGSTFDMNALVSTAGGAAGTKAADQPGGAAGTPVYATWYLKYATGTSTSPTYSYKLRDSHTSYAGANWIAPSSTPGAAGSILLGGVKTLDYGPGGPLWQWFKPSLVRQMLKYIRDAYLAGNVDYVKTAASALRDVFAQAFDAGVTDTAELDQLRNETDVINNRAQAGLDYFGNPAGWTPMLSFVANLASYQTEIDSAIRIKYLAQLVQTAAANNQSGIAALQSALHQLDTEMTRVTADLDEQQSLLPRLQSQVQAISAQTQAFQQALLARQQLLLQQAKKNLEPPFWRQALGVLGAIATVIPVGQPILGVVGAGLSTISTLSAQPLEAIGQIRGLAGTFDDVSGLMETTRDNFSSFTESLKPPSNATADELKTYVNGLRDYGTQWGGALKQISAAIQPYTAPRDELEAELSRLEAQDPTFGDLVGQLRTLNAQKEAFAQDLANSLKVIGESMNTINADQQAALTVNRKLSDATGRMDLETVETVKQMGERADERLLRYQYYMAKAYEYETLTPYPGSFKLQSLGDRIANVLGTGAGANWIDTPDNMTGASGLRTVYEDDLRTIANAILTKLNTVANGRRFKASNRPFGLSAAELKQLNDTGEVTINLVDRGLIQPGSQDAIKLVQMRAESISATVAGDSGGNFPELTIDFLHSGISKLRRDGRTFEFHHYHGGSIDTLVNEEPLHLGTTRYYVGLNEPATNDTADRQQLALLTYLLGSANVPAVDEVLYVQPAAWADITIRMHAQPGYAINLNSAVFRFDYTYENAATDKATLQVLSPTNANPVVGISSSGAEATGRTDGQGSFTRTFVKGQTVTLQAQPSIGGMEFDHWVNDANQTIGTQPTLNLTLSANRFAKPIYASSLAADAGSTGDGFLSESAQAVSLAFSRAIDPASVQASDLIVTNVRTGQRVDPSAFAVTLSDSNRRVTWTYNIATRGPMADGMYRVTLAAGTVSDAAAKLLGSDATFDFDVLGGDANHDGQVGFADLLTLARNYGSSGRAFSGGNFDYSPDGTVGFSDLLILARHYGGSLAALGGLQPSSAVATTMPLASSSPRRERVTTQVLS